MSLHEVVDELVYVGIVDGSVVVRVPAEVGRGGAEIEGEVAETGTVQDGIHLEVQALAGALCGLGIFCTDRLLLLLLCLLRGLLALALALSFARRWPLGL